MKELTVMKKETMNITHNGSLANRYEICYNKISSKMPKYNATLTIAQNIKKDKQLGPQTIEARMYELYEAEKKSEALTTELGSCTAKCARGSSSLLAKMKKAQVSLRQAR